MPSRRRGYICGRYMANVGICTEAAGNIFVKNPIFKMCIGGERMLGPSPSPRWWDQDHIREVFNRPNEGTEGEVE